MRTVLYRTKGTIIVDNTTPHLTLYLEQIDGAPFAAGQLEDLSEKTVRHMIRVPLDSHNIAEEHKAMLAAFRDGIPVITTGREGARTVCVCRAVVESAKTGKPVVIEYPV